MPGQVNTHQADPELSGNLGKGHFAEGGQFEDHQLHAADLGTDPPQGGLNQVVLPFALPDLAERIPGGIRDRFPDVGVLVLQRQLRQGRGLRLRASEQDRDARSRDPTQPRLERSSGRVDN